MEDLSPRTHHVVGREIEVIRDQLSRNRVALLQGRGQFVDDAVFNYPTLAEAYKVAALDVTNKLRAVERLRH